MVFSSSSVSAMSDSEAQSLWNMTLHKAPCAGGKGGYKFDSGCNPHGVARVHIECSPFDKCGHIGPYKSTIARIFVDFIHSTSSSADKNQFYWGCAVVSNKAKKTFTFELVPGDTIHKQGGRMERRRCCERGSVPYQVGYHLSNVRNPALRLQADGIPGPGRNGFSAGRILRQIWVSY